MRKVLEFILCCCMIACNVYETVEGDSKPSDKFFDTKGNTGSYPNTPTALSLNNSNLSDGGVDQTPPILVAGVASGETVKIFTDSGCTTEVGSASASGSTVVVTVNDSNKLTSTATVNFYANSTINGNTSSCSSATVSYFFEACPSGFIPVVMNSTFTNEDFCVAKYEMKSGPVSQSSGAPQTSVNKATAETNCTGMGTGYDLIANHQWQTIARDIEQTNSNWDGNVIGTNSINNGNYNAAVGPCDATIENLGVAATNCSSTAGDPTGSDYPAKRTHILSNSEVIWDLAGNASEWLKDNKPASDLSGSSGFTRIYQMTSSSPGTLLALQDTVSRNFKDQFGPYSDYSSTLTSPPYGRLGGISNISSTSTGIFRGGKIGDGAQASGIFAFTFDTPTISSANLGYRCVFTK